VWPLLAQASSNDGFRKVIDNLARTPLSVILKFVLILSVVRIAIYFLQQRVPAHKRSGIYAVGHMVSELFDALIYAGVFVFMIIRPFAVQAFLIPSGSMVQTLQVNDFIVANKLIYRYSDPKEGDIVVFRPPKRGVLDQTELDADGEVNVDFIKRCIGVPGDVIEIKKNVLYRNGKAVDEPYKAFTTPDPPFQQDTFRNLTPEEVKEKEITDFKLVYYRGTYWPVNMEMQGDQATLVNWEVASVVAPDYLAADAKTMNDLKDLPAAPVPKGYYLMMGDNRFGSFDSRGWGLVPRESIIGRSEFIWLPIAHWGRTRANAGSPAK